MEAASTNAGVPMQQQRDMHARISLLAATSSGRRRGDEKGRLMMTMACTVGKQ